MSFTLSGCALTRSLGGRDLPKQVIIEMKGKPGEGIETRYYSQSRTRNYSESQLLRDRKEAVDFSVLTQIESFDAVEKVLIFNVKTIRKDGTVALNDLAFPEMGEVIRYKVKSSGEVLQAGTYSPHSLFFIPSLPVPNGPVEEGDTWLMTHTWLSAREGIPLNLEVVAILKDILSCRGEVCVDLELSGRVGLMQAPTAPGARYSSRIWGRLLFGTESGDVIWSEMRSLDDMGVNKDRVVVESCMISQIKSASHSFTSAFACEPDVVPVSVVPKF